MPLGLEGVLYHAAALPTSLPSSQSLLVSGQHLTLALAQHSGAFADLQVLLRAMTGKDVGVRDAACEALATAALRVRQVSVHNPGPSSAAEQQQSSSRAAARRRTARSRDAGRAPNARWISPCTP